jgi:hypothetical protein
MKRLIALALTGTLLIGSAGFAQEKAMARQNAGIQATFYDGIPSQTGSLITDDFGQAVTASLVSSSIGRTIHDLEDAKYINLQVANHNFVFKMFGGDTTNEMTLAATTNDLNDADGTTISLGEVTAALNNAVTGKQMVAIFIDGDDVVQGFYTFTTTNLPTVNVEDADTLMLLSQNGVTSFEIADPGTVRLDTVLVKENNQYMPLRRAPAFEAATVL